MKRRQNSIFVAYFLFQHLMNSIYLRNNPNCVKLERVVVFIKFIASAVPLSFPPKTVT